MAGDATKVRMGAAWVYYGTPGGNVGEQLDLGYTKGGVTFAMETQSHEITVDQEGITPIAETLMGRRVTVTTPLAESDYEKLQKLIPESSWSAGTSTLEVSSGVGGDLMAATDELLIVSKQNNTDYIKIYKAAPVSNVAATFAPDGERIWPITWKGYVCESTHAHAGKLYMIHEAS